jgi:hypothetical protein
MLSLPKDHSRSSPAVVSLARDDYRHLTPLGTTAWHGTDGYSATDQEMKGSAHELFRPRPRRYEPSWRLPFDIPIHRHAITNPDRCALR